MKQEFKTAVIYARYSSDNQTEQSIEGQMRVCNDYAKNNNIVILDSYIDRAMTGTNDNRPAFQQMLKDSNKKLWDYVLVYKLDRFSRNKYETTIHKKTLKDNGVKVLSAMENIPDTPEGIILESLLEGMNQYYSAELSQKVKRGINESRLKGYFLGGHLMYGYKLDNKKIIIDEDKAQVIRYIFEQYANDVYVKDIIDDLTSRGILNHGKPFARNTIYNILRNEKYMGIYRFNNEIYTNLYPQIVPEELFNRVKDKINKNKYGKRSVDTVYLLKSKIKCGYCGSNITAESGTSKTGKKKRYYKCIGRKHNNGCQKTMLRKEYLENVVIDSIITELNKPATKKLIINELLKRQDEMSKNNYVLKLLKTELKQTETAISNIMKAIEQGIITKTTHSRLQELENKKEELEQNILLEKSKEIITLNEKEILEYYNQALRNEPSLLVNYLIKEIKLFDEKIQIYFNTPIEQSPDYNGQGFCIFKGIYNILGTKNNNLSGQEEREILLEMII